MARIWDISLAVAPGMLLWPGDPPVAIEPVGRLEDGAIANLSALKLGSHTGTHVDPPFHFFFGGATVDQLPLDALIGEAIVVAVDPANQTIAVADLEAAGLAASPAGATRVLFKTANSALWVQREPAFPDRYVAVSPEAATWLVDQGVRLVGVDFLSVEPLVSPGHPTHRILLAADVVIVEGLDLSRVAPGRYQLVCLPLRIAGGDGAPARAVLVELE